MGMAPEFVAERLRATQAAQEQLASKCVWEGKLVAQWADDQSALEAKRAEYEGLQAEQNRLRETG